MADDASKASKKKKGAKGLPLVPPEIQVQVHDEGVSRHLAQTAFNKLSSKDKKEWFEKAKNQHSENVNNYKRKYSEEGSNAHSASPKVPKDVAESSEGSSSLESPKTSKSAAKSQDKSKKNKKTASSTEHDDEARQLSYIDQKLKKNGRNLKIISNPDQSNNSVNTSVNESTKELEADKLKDEITSQFMRKFFLN